MHIHILGICGTFMGGIALLAKTMGHRVTGCDSGVYPPMSTQLEAAGIELIEGYAAEQTRLRPDYFVIGNAIARGNPLLEAILNQHLPYISGPQWLAEHILPQCHVLAVAGTHGKTTTAAMLAWILEEAQQTPGFLIGGVPLNFGCSARLSSTKTGSPAFFVIEADEYDTAFCDKRSKFIHYRPRTLVLNNLEFDHADIFKDLAAIETQFHHLIRTIPQQGLIIYNAQEPNLIRVLEKGCWSQQEKANDSAGWHLTGNDATGELALHQQAHCVARTHWQLTGEHNRANACAALLAARHAGVPLEKGLDALSRFRGVKRRLELRACVHNIAIYDDFAHHPTAIAKTLHGLRQKIGQQGLLAVLEPRSNTMKMGVMKAQLPESLSLADHVFCYSAHLSWDAHEALHPLGEKATIQQSLEGLIASICQKAQAGDDILIMSNGGFEGLHEKLIEALQVKYPT